MRRLCTLLLLTLSLVACDFDDVPNFIPENGVTNYRAEMRLFVREISNYAKARDRGFIVVPQNGIDLLTTSGATNGTLETSYLNALDGIGQEALFYGANGIDQPTPIAERERLSSFLDLAQDNSDAAILVTDFAISEPNIDDANLLIEDAGYVGFVADQDELDTIPIYPTEIPNLNRNDIEVLTRAGNFLHLTNPRLYASRQELVDAIAETDYDLVILDFFFNGEEYTREQIQQLRFKNNGGTRLLLAYMSIGQAQSERFYWENFWLSNPPSWLREEVAGTPGNYHVRYWLQPWQDIIFGSNDAYLDRIVNAGFDGVYLDHVDEYEYFEEL